MGYIDVPAGFNVCRQKNIIKNEIDTTTINTVTIMTTALTRFILLISMFMFSLSISAQNEIAFTNRVSFVLTGNASINRFVALIPAPVTNEYQEINSLKANCGTFIDINEANKVLFYDGAFKRPTFDIYESFYYKTRKVKIDFSNKSNKNIVTQTDPNDYLESDGVYINTNNKTIKEIGDRIWNLSSNTLDYAKRCYEYIASKYKYINGSWRTLNEILLIGGGECGDFTTLFVNLLRYKNIPARHNIGVWVNGGYHVWPDFYHEDYGWIPVDPTFKNFYPEKDYFGIYEGDLIILSQGLTTFSESDISIKDAPLQTYYYWYWYSSGHGSINATHKTGKGYLVTGINEVETDEAYPDQIFDLKGVMQKEIRRGINIVNGKKIFIK